VVHEGKIREKPESEEEAREFLKSYGQVQGLGFRV
jgi:predicted house-cleaning NTP pyrophosphatase (Maf/HAM1 superfamily)